MKPGRQILLLAAVVAAGVWLGLYTVRERRDLKERMAALQHRAELSRMNIQRAQNERAQAEREIAALERAAAQKPLTTPTTAPDPVLPPSTSIFAAPPVAQPMENPMATTWERNVTKLRALLTRFPQWSIPEIAFLDDEEFSFFARDLTLEDEESQRTALRDLRALAKRKLAPVLQDAVRDFAAANAGRLPSTGVDLDGYIPFPMPTAILQRYALVTRGLSASEPWMLFESAPPVDDIDDTRQIISTTLLMQMTTDRTAYLVSRAMAAYSAANGGRSPAQGSELVLYLEAPVEASTVEEMVQGWQKSPSIFGKASANFKGPMTIRPLNVIRKPIALPPDFRRAP